MAGVALGLVGVAAVGAVTFKLEQKLPYKRMLIVTGVLISLVLVVMVGNTMRTLQGVGWLSITPVDVDFPLWMGTWLGVFPTVETLGAQLAAFVFVIGSYFAAEWLRKRNVRKAIAEAEEQFEEPRSRDAVARTATATAGERQRRTSTSDRSARAIEPRATTPLAPLRGARPDDARVAQPEPRPAHRRRRTSGSGSIDPASSGRRPSPTGSTGPGDDRLHGSVCARRSGMSTASHVLLERDVCSALGMPGR